MMKMLKVEMPDGSKWGVPVEIIAKNRAEYYADEYDGDVECSLAEDTMPLFESDDYEVEDWACNNMNWSDVNGYAKLLEPSKCDFQEGWLYGEKSIVDIKDTP